MTSVDGVENMPHLICKHCHGTFFWSDGSRLLCLECEANDGYNN